MATVIDALVVKLGLDKRDYDKGADQVKKSLKDTRGQADKTGDQFKKTGKESSESFERITKSAVKFFALLGSTMAVKDFIRQTVLSNAALYRLSKNLDEHVSTVSAWSNAAEVAGGSASGLQGTMLMLSRAQTEMQLTGQSALIPYFSALGIAMADSSGHARSSSDMLLDLADRFSHMNRKTAFNMGQMMGIDPGTLNLLLKGRAAVEAMIEKQEQYGAVTKKQARQAELFRQQVELLKLKFLAFGRQLLSDAMPVLEKLFGVLSRGVSWMVQNKSFVEGFLVFMAAGLAAVAVAALPLTGTAAIIVALGAAIGLLWNDFKTWKDGGKSFLPWATWKSEIQKAEKWIQSLGDRFPHLKALLLDLGHAFKILGKMYVEYVIDEFKLLFHWLEKIAGPIGKLIDKALSFMDRVAGKLDKSGHWISEKLQAAHGIETGFFKKLGITGGSKKSGGGAPAHSSAHVTGHASEGAQAEAMKYFMSQGWTKAQAAGIVANLRTESSLNAGAVGDNGAAYGLGQWHGDRQANFEKLFGHSIKQGTYQEQLAFVQWELNHSERGAGTALRNAKTAQQAGAIVSARYERPADKAGNEARRGALAARIAGASQFSAGAGAGRTAAVSHTAHNTTVTNNIGEVHVHTQATDAKGVGEGLASSMDYSLTAHANTGLN
jgi:hypothetical protein